MKLKRLLKYRPAALAAIAYLDMVGACFATVMQMRQQALILTVSGLLLVVAAFCFAAAGDEDGE